MTTALATLIIDTALIGAWLCLIALLLVCWYAWFRAALAYAAPVFSIQAHIVIGIREKRAGVVSHFGFSMGTFSR